MPHSAPSGQRTFTKGDRPMIILRNDCRMRTGKDYQGTLRLNFRPVRMSGNFSLERYAFGVYMELHKALEGLVEK